MSRRIALLALTVGLLAAPAMAATEIVLWYSYRGLEKEALKTVVAQHNRGNPEVQIKLLQVPHDALADKISAAIPRGRGPDLFIFAQDRIGDWASSDVIQPVGFWADEAVQSRFLPRTLEAVTYDEDLYALPLAVKCTALYYNRKLVPEPPSSTEELIRIGRERTDPDAGSFGLVYENGLLYYQAAWLFGFGGGVLGPTAEPILDTKANARGLEFAVGLRRTHRIMPDEISNTVVTALFNEGKAGMAISGPWFRAEIQDGIDYGVALLPSIREAGTGELQARPFLSVEGILLSAESKHPREAFQVMSYLTDTPSALIRAVQGKQPVASTAAYADPGVQADPILATFREQAALAVPMPNIPEMRMVWTPMDRAIGKVLNGTATAQEALTEAQRKVQADLDRFHGKR